MTEENSLESKDKTPATVTEASGQLVQHNQSPQTTPGWADDLCIELLGIAHESLYGGFEKPDSDAMLHRGLHKIRYWPSLFLRTWRMVRSGLRYTVAKTALVMSFTFVLALALAESYFGTFQIPGWIMWPIIAVTLFSMLVSSSSRLEPQIDDRTIQKLSARLSKEDRPQHVWQASFLRDRLPNYREQQLRNPMSFRGILPGIYAALLTLFVSIVSGLFGPAAEEVAANVIASPGTFLVLFAILLIAYAGSLVIKAYSFSVQRAHRHVEDILDAYEKTINSEEE